MLYVPMIVCLRHSRARLIPAVLSSYSGTRFYATHKESAPPPLFSQQLDVKSREVWQRSSDVGPFQLGQMQYGKDESFKKWKDLNTSGKVMRSTARTSNFIVILFGAGFSAMLVYALATELFARNSPTVLYNEACEKIKRSSEVSKYLREPLRFHTTAPTLGRPQHRNRGVMHNVSYDASGKEHLLLNFYISSGHSILAGDSNLSFTERFQTWRQDAIDATRNWTFADLTDHVRVLWRRTSDYTRHIFRVLTNQGSSTTPTPMTPAITTADVQENVRKEQPRGWGVAGLFANLRGRTPNVISQPQQTNTRTDWEEAEVHGDLVRNDEGRFVWRYLVVEIPNSRVKNPLRIFVEGTDVASRPEAVPQRRIIYR